jgi:hypothetical protein
MVPGRVKGVELRHDRPSERLQGCRESQPASIVRETPIHRIKVELRHVDPVGISGEATRHPAALAESHRRRIECPNDRHHQGGGEGGSSPLAVRKESMHPTPLRSPLRPFAARLRLVALLVLALFTLSRCRMVGDRLTGVDVSLLCKRAPTCIVDCQKVANEAIRAESVLHVSRVKACGGDADCREAEHQRHRAAVHDIQAQRRECIGRCHHQGGGQAGD